MKMNNNNNNWRQILSWKEFPELSIADKIYIRNTGRIPPHLQTQVGLDLGNWGVYQHPSLGKVAIAMDVYRYIVTIENNDSGDVESYSIDYREIINNKINPFDFEKIIDLAYMEEPEDVNYETTIDELLEEEGVTIVTLV